MLRVLDFKVFDLVHRVDDRLIAALGGVTTPTCSPSTIKSARKSILFKHSGNKITNHVSNYFKLFQLPISIFEYDTRKVSSGIAIACKLCIEFQTIFPKIFL